MSDKKEKRAKPGRATNEQLAREASEWDRAERVPAEFRDAPEAVPAGGESAAISLRMPKKLLALLRAFAEREGVGYQVLLKRWIDDRLRAERDKLRAARHAAGGRERVHAPTFPLEDRREGESSHYRRRAA